MHAYHISVFSTIMSVEKRIGLILYHLCTDRYLRANARTKTLIKKNRILVLFAMNKLVLARFCWSYTDRAIIA